MDADRNDRAIAILTSQFYKQFCDKTHEIYYEHAKELFSITLDSMRDEEVYIIDMTERI